MTLAILAIALGTAACGDEPAGTGTAAPATPAASPATNGIDRLPTDQALAKATAAYLAASSVHVKGTIVDDGTSIALDLRQTRRGDSTGTITMDGAKIKVLTVGKTAYISGDRKFWTDAAGADAYDLFKGTWVKTKLSGADFAQFALFTDRKRFADGVLPTDGLRADRREDVRGAPAFRFEDATDAGYYVSLTAEPVPVRFAGEDGGSKIALDFLDYGAPVELTPPPASKVVEAP
jgi:hypothetical protein